jgi:hypothetical protein
MYIRQANGATCEATCDFDLSIRTTVVWFIIYDGIFIIIITYDGFGARASSFSWICGCWYFHQLRFIPSGATMQACTLALSRTPPPPPSSPPRTHTHKHTHTNPHSLTLTRTTRPEYSFVHFRFSVLAKATDAPLHLIRVIRVITPLHTLAQALQLHMHFHLHAQESGAEKGYN